MHREGVTECCPFSNSKQASQPSHLIPLHSQPPSWQLASFQRENKSRRMWFYLPNWQLFLLGLAVPFSLAPAILTRLKFIVQHSSTEIWLSFLICRDTAAQAPSRSLLLQDPLTVCSVQPLVAGGSEALRCWEPKELALLPFTPPRVAFPPSNTSCSPATFPFPLQLPLPPDPDALGEGLLREGMALLSHKAWSLLHRNSKHALPQFIGWLQFSWLKTT